MGFNNGIARRPNMPPDSFSRAYTIRNAGIIRLRGLLALPRYHLNMHAPTARHSDNYGTRFAALHRRADICTGRFKGSCNRCADPTRPPKVAESGSAMIDRWTERLHCMHCGGAGLATLSQAKGAQVPTVESVTGAFKVMHTEYGPDRLSSYFLRLPCFCSYPGLRRCPRCTVSAPIKNNQAGIAPARFPNSARVYIRPCCHRVSDRSRYGWMTRRVERGKSQHKHVNGQFETCPIVKQF
jgi:hypothetical protein